MEEKNLECLFFRHLRLSSFYCAASISSRPALRSKGRRGLGSGGVRKEVPYQGCVGDITQFSLLGRFFTDEVNWFIATR